MYVVFFNSYFFKTHGQMCHVSWNYVYNTQMLGVVVNAFKITILQWNSLGLLSKWWRSFLYMKLVLWRLSLWNFYNKNYVDATMMTSMLTLSIKITHHSSTIPKWCKKKEKNILCQNYPLCGEQWAHEVSYKLMCLFKYQQIRLLKIFYNNTEYQRTHYAWTESLEEVT
jgi:hypothetical protein